MPAQGMQIKFSYLGNSGTVNDCPLSLLNKQINTCGNKIYDCNLIFLLDSIPVESHLLEQHF